MFRFAQSRCYSVLCSSGSHPAAHYPPRSSTSSVCLSVKASNLFSSNGLKELPEDVIENNILTRLPIKSLIRFTCVSKRWRYVTLYSPKFAKSQYRSASDHKSITHGILVSSNGSPQLNSLDLESPWFGHDSSARKLHFPFEKQLVRCCNLLASSNGLVFVALDERFNIWNPSTRFFMIKKLPDIGAGYLSATDNYKVVAGYMLRGQEEGEDNGEVVHNFSLREHIWRMIDIHNLGSDVFPTLHGTLSNEALHWLHGYSNSRYDLVAFDFG